MKNLEHLAVLLMIFVLTTFDCWLARVGTAPFQPPPRARWLFLAAFLIFSSEVAGAMMEQLAVLVDKRKVLYKKGKNAGGLVIQGLVGLV